jgi:cullin-associated NEDD8-dissociated protein 1
MKANIRETVEKMKNPDPDIRYMATRDFITAVNNKKIESLTEEDQRKIVSELVVLLKDENSNDVKDVAIECTKTITPMLTSPKMIEMMFESFGKTLFNTIKKNDNDRDVIVEVMGLILPIIVINKEFKNLVIPKFANPLLEFFKLPDLTELSVGFNLQTLNVVIDKDGADLDVNKVIDTLLPLLDTGVPANRRRAVQCLGNVVRFASDEQIKKIISKNFDLIKKSENKEQTRICLLLFTNICAGIKGKYKDYIMDTFKIAKQKFDSCGDDDSNEDLKETILNLFNVMIISLPTQVDKVVQEIFEYANKYLTYNPNVLEFSDDEEGGMDEEPMEDEEEEGGVSEEDIDDQSWKLRKLSSEIIGSIVLNRNDMLSKVLNESVPLLVKGLKESVEIVLDVHLQNFISIYYKCKGHINDEEKIILEKAIKDSIQSIIDVAKSKKFKENTKIECFDLLKEMVIFNFSLVGESSDLLNPIVTSLLKSDNTSIELVNSIFGTLREFFKVNNLVIASATTGLIVELFENRNFRLASEAIRTVKVLCQSIEPDQFLKLEGAKVISQLLRIIPEEKDNELKEQVVLTLGVIIKKFGNVIDQTSLKECISTIITLTDNTFMRVYALEVISNISSDKFFIANSNANDLFSKVLSDALRGNRQEKVVGLKVLTELYSSNEINKKIVESSLKPIGDLVFDNDPVIIEGSLNLLTLFAKKEDIAKKIIESEFERFVEKVKTNIREAAIAPLVKLTEALSISCKSQVIQLVMNIKNHLYPRTSLMAMGFMYGATKPNKETLLDELKKAVEFFSKPQEKSDKYYLSIVHIYAVGYLASIDVITLDEASKLLIKLVEHQADEVRQAVSVALGKLKGIISFLFESFSSKKTFAVAAALKEAVKSVEPQDAERIIEQLSKINVDSDEDLIMPIADCYGILITKKADEFVPKYYYPALENKKLSAAIIGSIKTSMMSANVNLFVPLIPLIVKRLDEKFPPVKMALFSVVNYIISNAPGEIKPYLFEIMNKTIPQLEVDQNYVKIAKFANVQHIIDSGVDSRKAVYEMLSSLIDNFLGELDFTSIVKNVLSGIEKDSEHDIKLMCFSLLTKLSSLNLGLMAQHIEDFIPQLRKIIEPSLDEKNKNQDSQKQTELSKSVCKFVHEVSKYELIKVSSSFNKLEADIQNSNKLGPIFKSMKSN